MYVNVLRVHAPILVRKDEEDGGVPGPVGPGYESEDIVGAVLTLDGKDGVLIVGLHVPGKPGCAILPVVLVIREIQDQVVVLLDLRIRDRIGYHRGIVHHEDELLAVVVI